MTSEPEKTARVTLSYSELGRILAALADHATRRLDQAKQARSWGRERMDAEADILEHMADETWTLYGRLVPIEARTRPDWLIERLREE